ncbi:MAG: 6-carboxytetrahydropterin synthase [Nitrososphaerota archaeon]
MITCTKRIEFDYGHRVVGHSGKCANLHGHRGIVEVTCIADELDDLGMVIDFGTIKEKIARWINENWDHNLILSYDDPMLSELGIDSLRKLHGRDCFVMASNPTAEEMARYLLSVAQALLPNVRVLKVRMWETPNSYAEAISDGIQSE